MAFPVVCQFAGPLNLSEITASKFLSDAIPNLALENLLMTSSDTAILWLSDSASAFQLASKGDVALDETTTASFYPAEQVSSSYIEISSSYLSCILELSEEIRVLAENAIIFSRTSKVLMGFSNPSAATEFYKKLQAIFPVGNLIKHVRQVNLAEHAYVPCQLRHRESDERASSENLAPSRRRALTDSIQDVLNLEAEQVVVLDIIPNALGTRSEPSDARGLLLFCPTAFDAEALKKLRFIEVSENLSLVVTSEDMPISIPNVEEECIATPRSTFPPLAGPSNSAEAASEEYSALPEHSAISKHYDGDDYCLTGGTTDRSRSNSTHCSNGATSAETTSDHIGQNAGSEVDSYVCASSIDNLNETLNLESYVIANHFKSLLRWAVDDDSKQSVAAGDFPFVSEDCKRDGKYGFLLQHSPCQCTLSWTREDSGKDSERESPSAEAKKSCSIGLLIDTRVKLYTITLSAPTLAEVKQRVAAVEHLIGVLEKMSHRMTLTGWMPQHREAINQSDELRGREDHTRSTVLFHNSKEKVISADVLSVSASQQDAIMHFLAGLIPAQADWLVSFQHISEFSITKWTEIQTRFTIKVNAKWKEMPQRGDPDWTAQLSSKRVLRVWGFETYIDKALTYILQRSSEATDFSSSSSVGSGWDKYPDECDSPVLHRTKRVESSRRYQDCADEYDDEEDEEDGDHIVRHSRDPRDRKVHRGQFAFQDRESGMFFQAFEPDFKAFLWQNFGARIAQVEPSSSRAAAFTAVTQVQRRTPLLKLDFTCDTRSDVVNVKSYFEKFATFNFPRQQIHFPRCHGTWFKDISNEKDKSETQLRAIRRQATVLAAQADSARARAVGGVAGERAPDPLHTPGFLNIRMKPPLHSRGIRRMTLPTDLTVTICGPMNSEAQKMDYNTTFEKLAAHDCHYVTASVQIYLKAPVARTVALRASRDDFIALHGLIAVKWEENNQRRAIENSSMFDDQCSSGSESSYPQNPSSGSALGSDDQLGVAKLWSSKPETMTSVLHLLCCDGSGAVIASNDSNVIKFADAHGIAAPDLVRGRAVSKGTLSVSGRDLKFEDLPGNPFSSSASPSDMEREAREIMLKSVGSSGSDLTSNSSGYRRYTPPGFIPHGLSLSELQCSSMSSPGTITGGTTPSGHYGGNPVHEDLISRAFQFNVEDGHSTESAPFHPLSRANSAGIPQHNGDRSPSGEQLAVPLGLRLAIPSTNDWERMGPDRMGSASPASHSYMQNAQKEFMQLHDRQALMRTHSQQQLQSLGAYPYPTLSPSASNSQIFNPIGANSSARSSRDSTTTKESESRISAFGSASWGGHGPPSYDSQRDLMPSMGMSMFRVSRELTPTMYGDMRMDPNNGPVKRASYPGGPFPHQPDVYATSPQSAGPHRHAQMLGLGPSQFIESRSLVHWPHPSFRFMFLGDPLKHQLGELLHKYRVRGVGITTPFRDKSNPTACLSIEGTNEGVAAATAHVNAYFRSVTNLIRNVTMVLTAAQREKLTSSDLTRVKEIQGAAGVHIVLNPLGEDIADTVSSFDLRLPHTDFNQASGMYAGRAGPVSGDPNVRSVPLITVRVLGLSGGSTEVSVVANNAGGDGGSNWGVGGLLLFVDPNALNTFNPQERKALLRGEAVVNSHPHSGKIVISVYPKVMSSPVPGSGSDRYDNPYPTNGGGEYTDREENEEGLHQYGGHARAQNTEAEQQSALVQAVSEGLAAADHLQLLGLALTSPTGNIALCELSENLIHSLTVEATVSFLRKTSNISLQRIVCVDFTAGEEVANSLDARSPGRPLPSPANRFGKEVIPGDILLQPLCGNRMANTLLLLLEQEAVFVKNAEFQRDIAMLGRHNNPYSVMSARDLEDPPPVEATIRLVACNTPLPPSVLGHVIYPPLRAHRRPAGNNGYAGYDAQFLRNGNEYGQQYDPRHDEPCVIVIRGLAAGIVRAVGAVRNLLASSPPTSY